MIIYISEGLHEYYKKYPNIYIHQEYHHGYIPDE